VVVTASNAVGSNSATSAQTGVVSAPTTGNPRSFYTGPLGQNNLLPPAGKAFLGTWPPGWNGSTWDQQRNLLLSREAYFGRRFGMVHLHYAAPRGGCYYDAPLSDARAQWVRENGYRIVISWSPGWTIDEINAGKADACLRDVGQRFAAWGTPFLLRIYWEFNSGDPYWGGWGQPFIDAWKRTVDVIRSQGATNVGFVWSPDGGYQSRTAVSYPGDNYVDWVGVSSYNPNATWCSPFNPGPWCELAEELSFTFLNDPTYWTVYDRYSQTKPFMVAEWGSVEDATTPGRKGQWFRNFEAKLSQFPNIRALTYFDVDLTDVEHVNWRLDTSQSSLDGFRELALDPALNTGQ
jgi:hypothetical protein